MKKSLGSKPFLPSPVYMVATYDEKDRPDVMMLCWGGISSGNHVALNLENDHKTLDNLKLHKAFTIGIADAEDLSSCDYAGMVSAFHEPDKFKNTGFHAFSSQTVHAPVIEEFPIVLECVVEEFQKQPYGDRVLGKIENVLVDERLLDEKGEMDYSRFSPFWYNPIDQGYFTDHKKIGQAFSSGSSRMQRNRQDK